MASYDSPGYTDKTPGGPVNQQAFTAPGSTGITSEATAGPVVGTPVASVPGVSSQLDIGRQTLPVTAGDTSSFSSDRPVNPGPLLPDWEGASSTGAGQGRPRDLSPNAGR